MHIYFGHTGVHLLPFVDSWQQPCIVSFHGADVMLRDNKGGYADRLRSLLNTVPLVTGALPLSGEPPGSDRLSQRKDSAQPNRDSAG